MPPFVFGDENQKKYIYFTPEGLLISHGWTVAISHEDMKFYLRRYFSADKMTHLDPEKGFFRDALSGNSVHEKGILSHKGAKMAFDDGELEAVINWLAAQYGTDV